jgi:hypothetical protein
VGIVGEAMSVQLEGVAELLGRILGAAAKGDGTCKLYSSFSLSWRAWAWTSTLSDSKAGTD